MEVKVREGEEQDSDEFTKEASCTWNLSIVLEKDFSKSLAFES